MISLVNFFNFGRDKRLKKLIKFALIFSIILLFTMVFCSDFQNNEFFIVNNMEFKFTLKTDSPITINNNLDFEIYKTKGNGSAINPFIIEYYFINASEPNGNGIFIKNTNAYFILRNCIIIGSSSRTCGIYLENVTNGEIMNNTVRDHFFGIYLFKSTRNTVYNNTANNNHLNYDGYTGIYLSSSNYNTFINNTINASNQCHLYRQLISISSVPPLILYNGIYLYSSNYNIFTHNIVSYHNNYGIYLLASNNNTFNYNTANYNGQGILLNFANNNTLINNSFINSIFLYESSNNLLTNNIADGISLYTSGNNQIHNNRLQEIGISLDGWSFIHFIQEITADNMADSRPIYYYKHEKDKFVAENAAQVILVNCSFMEVLNCNLSAGSLGISVFYSNYNKLINNTIEHNKKNGIYFYQSSHNTLVNNTINHNEDAGICLLASYNNTVIQNIAQDNRYGIYLGGSQNNTVTNNNANYNHYYGIFLDSASNNTLINNTFYHNDVGICLDRSNYNKILTNIANNNSGSGISLIRSSHNTLSNNTANYNHYYGISLASYSNYNRISLNLLHGNLECVREDQYCTGNILENNDCPINGPGIPGFVWSFILLGLVLIIPLLIISKQKRFPIQIAPKI